MDFRRSGQLDERRRRVLMDELAANSADTGQEEPTRASGPLRAYSEEVLADRQPRVTDLIPVRPFLVTVLILVAVTGVAALETLHIYFAPTARSAAAVGDQLAAIDLTSRGSIGGWYGGLLLGLGAVASLIIFNVRCHRVDDYRGHYRIWLWTAAALLWGSLDCVTSLHEIIGAGLASWTGGSQWADLCWLGVYLLLFGTLGVRLAIETWHSLGALSTLGLAAVFYLLAGMQELGLLPQATPLVATVLASSIVLLAHVSLVAAISLYARHVHLDAAGKLPLRLRAKDGKKRRKSKAKLSVVSKEQDEPEPASEAFAEGDDDDTPPTKDNRSPNKSGSGPSQSPPPPSRTGPLAGKFAAAQARATDEDDAEDDDEEHESGQQLSKSERRRLKKLARRDQQRRAA